MLVSDTAPSLVVATLDIGVLHGALLAHHYQAQRAPVFVVPLMVAVTVFSTTTGARP